MRAIAASISATGTLLNHQSGNGPDGRSGPVPRVSAVALGGQSGDNTGINKTFLTDYGTRVWAQSFRNR